MIGRKFVYKCQLQRADTGEIFEQDNVVGWDPAKIDHKMVADALAAELTVETKVKHVGLSAVLQAA